MSLFDIWDDQKTMRQSARGKLVDSIVDDVEAINGPRMGIESYEQERLRKDELRKAIEKRLDQHFGPANQT